MGLNYNYAISSLWFPQTTLNSDGTTNSTYSESGAANGEVYCYVNNNTDTTMMLDVPHSKYGTCFAMGLMLAYNQYLTTDTTDTTLRSYVTGSSYPAGMAGGLGRTGAQKIVIFETDGIVNTGASANLVSVGTVGSTPGYKYYKVRYDPTNATTQANSEFPGGASAASTGATMNDWGTFPVVDQLKTLGTTRKPFRLYALGFGPIYSSTATDYTRGTTMLAQMQSTGTPTATSTPVTLDPSQLITGTDDQMAVLLQTALTTVLQGGLQCALVK
jgi:hypothetical protein